MNRIQQKAGQVQPVRPRAQVLAGKLYKSSDSGVQHNLFSPIHYEPNYAYPLVVWLHGPAGDEQQLQRIMPLISMRNYAAVAPRGNREDAACSGYTWGQTSSCITASENRVFDAIDIAQHRFHIAPHRIFLAGYQSGGTMAVRIALKYPDRFAGALSLGGCFPEGNSPLSRLNDARQLPIFLSHGRESTLYTTDHACHQLRLFHAAGMCISMRQYPGGDYLDTQMLHDMDVWMMDIVTGQQAC